MRVVSWNIELGRDMDGAIDGLMTRNELAEFDVLLVQEMSPESAATLADGLASFHVYAPTGVHPKTGLPFGNAVLSPHPIIENRSVLLPHQAIVSGFPRGTVGAAIEIDGTVVWCYSVHTEIPLMSRRRRREQFERAAAEVSSHRTPVVVGGDFNTASKVSKADLQAVMRNAGFEGLTPFGRATLKRFGMSFSLDHLFGRDVTAVRSGISRRHLASDHYPIHVDLAFGVESSHGRLT